MVEMPPSGLFSEDGDWWSQEGSNWSTVVVPMVFLLVLGLGLILGYFVDGL